MDTDQFKPDFLELALGCQAEKAIGRAGYILVEKNHGAEAYGENAGGQFQIELSQGCITRLKPEDGVR